MRILFVPLALLLLALCSFSSSLEAAKSEDNRGESVGGMEETVDNKPGYPKAIEKRAIVMIDKDYSVENFNNDLSPCKCLKQGYCEKLKKSGNGYTEVLSCGKGCYSYCDASGCRKVCDGDCTCQFGSCVKCDGTGCHMVPLCKGMDPDTESEEGHPQFPSPTNCKECDDAGCNGVECHELGNECSDSAHDILFKDKCSCKRDDNGNEVCEMCGEYSCRKVPDCSRFSSCKCMKGERDDSLLRCYGYTNGPEHCRTLSTCSEFLKSRDQRSIPEKRAIVRVDAGMTNFNKDDSVCKCLRSGYCEKKDRDGQEYDEVENCGEASCYQHCDASGCKEVCDGQCNCDDNGRCERCHADGCKIVHKCTDVVPPSVKAENCETCDDYGCKKVECAPECDKFGVDLIFDDKCSCKKDTNGKETCEICGKFRCDPVKDCSRFAKCRCMKEKRTDSYRRCYGFTHGSKDCRTLTKCSTITKIVEDRAEKIRILNEDLANAQNGGRSRRFAKGDSRP